MGGLKGAVLAVAMSTLGWSGAAYAFGVGVEGGGSATFVNYSGTSIGNASSNVAGSSAFGIIVEDEFSIPFVFFDVWADGQTPTLQLQTTGPSTAKYLPFDLGARIGLSFFLRPYVGLFGQMAFPVDDGGGPQLATPIFGVGGDIGLDIAVFIFRFGVEVRGVDVLTPIFNVPQTLDSGGRSASGAYELQGLASARFSF